MARRRGSKDDGRYVVDEHSSSSLNAMTAYASALAMRERRTTYVRVLGQSEAVRRCEYDEDTNSVTVRVTE